MDAGSGGEKEREKDKEKEKERDYGSRKLWIFELSKNEDESDEEIDTNLLGIECSFYPKEKKRVKTVGVQYSIEELSGEFDNSSVGRREATQQSRHNRVQVQGQQNIADLKQLQLQEMPQQGDTKNISEQPDDIRNISEESDGTRNISEESDGTRNISEESDGTRNISEESDGTRNISEKSDDTKNSSE